MELSEIIKNAHRVNWAVMGGEYIGLTRSGHIIRLHRHTSACFVGSNLATLEYLGESSRLADDISRLVNVKREKKIWF